MLAGRFQECLQKQCHHIVIQSIAQILNTVRLMLSGKKVCPNVCVCVFVMREREREREKSNEMTSVMCMYVCGTHL